MQSQFCLSSEAVKWASDPASAVISRDQSLKPAIVTLIVCFPTLSFNVAGALPTNEIFGDAQMSVWFHS
jgi:hypothetical protein